MDSENEPDEGPAHPHSPRFRNRVALRKNYPPKPSLTELRVTAIEELDVELKTLLETLQHISLFDGTDIGKPNEIETIYIISGIIASNLGVLQKSLAESPKKNSTLNADFLHTIVDQLTALLATESININDAPHTAFKAALEEQLARTKEVQKLFTPKKTAKSPPRSME